MMAPFMPFVSSALTPLAPFWTYKTRIQVNIRMTEDNLQNQQWQQYLLLMIPLGKLPVLELI